ncbi:hypothetical protein CEUSTIGMA_g7860.t1 [Chlamydomonas eustigma]|uniref:Methyltransferase domain-containing protein n=1 Tax=Chlamydomonas eustigma TaxID=1157962 RepID=A0A250XBF5_9CHLO|nr:hypothetical protein CEUSTIGMA_g7860.t1 [Chlamydomonas eustigma]|eukprot:GAX80421.1 hypothetical protein CEUSTIGMA_g7860.t1 [Chlamydomonas eustigma]
MVYKVKAVETEAPTQTLLGLDNPVESNAAVNKSVVWVRRLPWSLKRNEIEDWLLKAIVGEVLSVNSIEIHIPQPSKKQRGDASGADHAGHGFIRCLSCHQAQATMLVIQQQSVATGYLLSHSIQVSLAPQALLNRTKLQWLSQQQPSSLHSSSQTAATTGRISSAYQLDATTQSHGSIEKDSKGEQLNSKQHSHRQHLQRRRRAQLLRKGQELERILSLLTPPQSNTTTTRRSLQEQYQPLVPLFHTRMGSEGYDQVLVEPLLTTLPLGDSKAVPQSAEKVNKELKDIDWATVPAPCQPSEGNEQRRLLKDLVHQAASKSAASGEGIEDDEDDGHRPEAKMELHLQKGFEQSCDDVVNVIAAATAADDGAGATADDDDDDDNGAGATAAASAAIANSFGHNRHYGDLACISSRGQSLRVQRKRAQVESFYIALQQILRAAFEHGNRQRSRFKIVEFGCGSGNLVLPLAYMMPECEFHAVDFKEAAVMLLRARALQAGLRNVTASHGRIEKYEDEFDVALALHACGSASDWAMLKAQQCRAAFIVSPCCIGKIEVSSSSASENDNEQIDQVSLNQDFLPRPRSNWLGSSFERGLLDADKAYQLLAKAADISHYSSCRSIYHMSKAISSYDEEQSMSLDSSVMNRLHTQSGSPLRQQEHSHPDLALQAKTALELDRLLAAKEQGYSTVLTKLLRPYLLPTKADLLIGIPKI